LEELGLPSEISVAPGPRRPTARCPLTRTLHTSLATPPAGGAMRAMLSPHCPSASHPITTSSQSFEHRPRPRHDNQPSTGPGEEKHAVARLEVPTATPECAAPATSTDAQRWIFTSMSYRRVITNSSNGCRVRPRRGMKSLRFAAVLRRCPVSVT